MRKRYLIVIIIFLSSKIVLYSQDARLSNVDFKALGKIIEIKYDLDGEDTDEYKIDCFLKDEQEPNFNYKLISVKGDIGKGKFVGKNRTIKWNYLDEFPNGLSGDSFYFLVTVEEITSGFGWYYYVGAAALTGGVAAALLMGKESPNKTSDPVYASYPDRP